MLRSVGINVIVVEKNVSTKFRVKDNAGSQLDLAAATTILPQSGVLKTVLKG
jgi:hypothetical protein